MIFVTVGTHEQPFNRLLKKIDDLCSQKIIDEEVIVQTGYSTYNLKNCTGQQFLPYAQMWENVRRARIIITHGGPSSFIMPLQIGKVPIVVPRQAKFDEHVNNHQLDFANSVAARKKNIIVVDDISELADDILHYDVIKEKLNNRLDNNNLLFNKNLERIITSIVK
jgi:UDP-N-acetylglucosamine transferase subunit ALG13